MKDNTNIPLVSSEIAGIWSSFVGDTLLQCILKHFFNNVEDNEVRDILQYTLDLSNQHIEELTTLFNKENLSIPQGFNSSDVNIDAPRLFTDSFYLQYLGYVSRVEMHNYTLILNQIARFDITDYFSKCIYESIEIYKKSAQLRLSKGIFIRAPHVEVPKDVQYVKSKSFLLDWFGEKRPLLTLEITHIFATIFSNIIGRAILTGFGQVCKNKKVSDYFFRGKNIITQQIGILTSTLTDEGIPIPSSSDSYVTDSTVAPFSEKLMLNKVMLMCSSSISSIGMVLADTRRSDLRAQYIDFMDKLIKYAKEGADIMIENGWFEQPPQAIKHENLVEV